MHHGTIIVAELIQQLDGCDPPRRGPPGPPALLAVCLRDRPRHRSGQVELDDTTFVYLGEGIQLGYLPENVRSNSAASPPATSKE
jgi:hypothetical protein